MARAMALVRGRRQSLVGVERLVGASQFTLLLDPPALLGHIVTAGSGPLSGAKRKSIFWAVRSVCDPGCVKTLRRCYDSPVILGGIDGALR